MKLSQLRQIIREEISNLEEISSSGIQLTGAWKVLFKHEYMFHINQGKSHKTAELLAMQSIRDKQNLAKKVRKREYGH